MKYPSTRTVDQVDDYHGTKVSDPYRWLEEVETQEVQDWMRAQTNVARAFLDNWPEREKVQTRLASLIDVPMKSTPFRRGPRWFQYRNDGTQNQAVLYVMGDPDDEGRVLVDPNAMGSRGEVSLGAIAPSLDGRLLAYATNQSGSSWMTWRIKEIESGRDLADELNWVKFGAAWTPDGKGFFYTDYEPPAEGETFQKLSLFQRIKYHELGRNQPDDPIVFCRTDVAEAITWFKVSDDGRYLVLTTSRGTDPENALSYIDLPESWDVVDLLGDLDAYYHYIGNDGPVWYVQTDNSAPNGRVVAIDTESGNRTEIVAESDRILSPSGYGMLGDNIFTSATVDTHVEVFVHGTDCNPRGRIETSRQGSIYLSEPNRDDEVLFLHYSDFLTPASVLRFDHGSVSTYFAPDLGVNPDDFVAEEVFVESSGVRVPMTVVRHKDTTPDGERPVLMTGYGGFGIPMLPGFSSTNLVWMEMGGVFVSTNLRGGGEYGREWHDAGRLANKQNVFDDLFSCAQWLFDNGWTKPSRTAIRGGSNGGLLVGACMTQRPDMFGACVPAVGVLDMLRYDQWTSGKWWVGDYGSAGVPEQFTYLHAYSPLHRVVEGTSYPPTMVMAGDHDDHVASGHSMKFAAALQAAQGGPAPVLLRVEFDTGHGSGRTRQTQLASETDVLAFLFTALE